MANTDIFYTTRAKLKALYDAIRAKAGTSSDMTIDQAITAVENIPAGSNDDINTLLTGGESTWIYENSEITTLADNAMNGCLILSLSLPNVTTIGANSIAGVNGDTSLVSVELASCTNVAYGALQNRTILESVSIPSCLSIGGLAFQGDLSLKNLKLEVCGSIGANAFKNSGLTSLTLLRTESMCRTNATAFEGTPLAAGSGHIYVPANMVDTYKSDSSWSALANYIEAWEG